MHRCDKAALSARVVSNVVAGRLDADAPELGMLEKNRQRSP